MTWKTYEYSSVLTFPPRVIIFSKAHSTCRHLISLMFDDSIIGIVVAICHHWAPEEIWRVSINSSSNVVICITVSLLPLILIFLQLFSPANEATTHSVHCDVITYTICRDLISKSERDLLFSSKLSHRRHTSVFVSIKLIKWSSDRMWYMHWICSSFHPRLIFMQIECPLSESIRIREIMHKWNY